VADHPLVDSAFGVGQKGWHSSFPVDASQVDHPNGYGWFPCAIITPANDGMRPCIHFFKNKLLLLLLLLLLISLYRTVEILKYSNLGEGRAFAAFFF
jgi:hypothetical protein